MLLTIPAALCLYVLGKPAIRLLLQHGAFTAHSTALTYTALTSYAVALPGLTAVGLLVLCFYAMKDAKTPLFAGVAMAALHICMLVLLVRIVTGSHAILAISLTTAITVTVQSLLLALILFWRLRAKVKIDRGLHRLQMRRLHAENTKAYT